MTNECPEDRTEFAHPITGSPDFAVQTVRVPADQAIFSGGGMFLIRCSGKGDLWFNTYGGMIELDVDGEYVVDTGHIVAFTDGLRYNVTKVGGYKSLFLSGEGLVCRFSGRGKVWIQTRQAPAFAAWAQPFRQEKKSNKIQSVIGGD